MALGRAGRVWQQLLHGACGIIAAYQTVYFACRFLPLFPRSYVAYQYRLRSIMQQEVRAIMAQYMVSAVPAVPAVVCGKL